jgi:4-hydroxybenzoate polyprenyltransferase
MTLLGTYLKLIRAKQWLKNLFVFAPLIFSAKLSEPNSILRSLLIFVAFCLVSSSVYIFNDIRDIESDRLHWRKKKRPLAAGDVSTGTAMAVTVLFLGAASLISLRLPFLAGLFLAVYVAINVFYTLKGKEMVLIDAFCISAGFVFRVIAGAYAIEVNPTGWIVVTTFFLALFLGFGKRRNELLLSEAEASNHRRVFKDYNSKFLDYLMVATSSITIISYSLYCLDPSVINKFNTDKLVYTVPFVTYGVFRYLLLLFKNVEGDPTEVVTGDAGIILSAALWFVSVLLVVYIPVWF